MVEFSGVYLEAPNISIGGGSVVNAATLHIDRAPDEASGMNAALWVENDLTVLGGDLGIRTTTPDTTLQVVGDSKFGDDNTNYTSISSTGSITQTGSAVAPLTGVTIDGTVPIGLDMSGRTFATAIQNWPATPVINVAGTKLLRIEDGAIYNFFFGTAAFGGAPGGITQAQNEGGNNIGIGFRAGYNNDSSSGGSFGKDNVYIGKQAGYGSAASSGYQNVAIGVSALAAITSGYTNVAVGGGAGGSLTTGARNFLLGNESGRLLTTGNRNVAIGKDALWSATAAESSNMCIGYNAGRLIAGGASDANRNIFIGDSAGVNSTSGKDNIAIGSSSFSQGAGSGQASMHFNTCIGSLSGRFMSAGASENVYIGYLAGYGMTTGDGNVFLGPYQGKTANGIISAVTESNLLAIGNQNPASNLPLIEGYFAAHASGPKLFINGDLTFHNVTQEDTDGGRETILDFRGEQSGGEETSLFKFEASHDGAADDQLGKGIWSINTGAGVVDGMMLDSNGLTIGDLSGNDTVIGLTGDVTFTGTAGLQFSGVYSAAAMAWIQTSAAHNTWYDIVDSNMTSGPLNGITHDGNGKLTVAAAGMYLINYTVCWENDAVNDHVMIGIEIDDGGTAEVAGRGHSENKFANQEEHLSGTAILDLAASSYIEISIMTMGATTPDFLIHAVNITMVQVGGT